MRAELIWNDYQAGFWGQDALEKAALGDEKDKGKFGANAMKRVAAGARGEKMAPETRRVGEDGFLGR